MRVIQIKLKKKCKKTPKYLVIPKNSRTFALAFETKALEIDSLAQQVEHNTFNVGVMGSSPMRVTVSEKGLSITESPFFVSIYFLLRIYKILLLAHLQNPTFASTDIPLHTLKSSIRHWRIHIRHWRIDIRQWRTHIRQCRTDKRF